MKRLATLAFLIVVAASPAGADSLPAPVSPFGRSRPVRLSHGMRSDAGSKLPKPVMTSSLDRHRYVRLTHGMRAR